MGLIATRTAASPSLSSRRSKIFSPLSSNTFSNLFSHLQWWRQPIESQLANESLTVLKASLAARALQYTEGSPLRDSPSLLVLPVGYLVESFVVDTEANRANWDQAMEISGPELEAGLRASLLAMREDLDTVSSIKVLCGGENPACLELELSKLRLFGGCSFGMLPAFMFPA